MRILEKLIKVNIIQFVPAVFIASLVVNSMISYTAPKTEKMTATPKSVQAANSTETKKVSMGSLDLSKIKDGIYEGEGNGFRGKVKVAVTVKAHKMTAIKVLSTSDDTAYFNRASSGVIKALLAKQTLAIDVVSGATYSSKGIIAAVKNALTGEKDTSSSAGAGSSSNSAGKVGSTDESGNYKDGTYTGSAQGYHGLVSVSVTIKNNKIKGIKILKNYDDAAYFNRAKGTLIPLMLKKQTTNVDAVSGATYSSNGIIKAVRAALKKASVKKSNSSSGSNDSSSNNSKPNSSTSSKPEGVAGTYKDGTYEGSGTGFRGNVKVVVTIKGGVISQIKVVEEKDDAAYFNKARGVIAFILKSQNTKVDVVSGATYSSNGIIKAVENALKKALVSGDTSSGDNTNDESTDDT
ncbi:MAG: FMN-binding protein, partial [Anaerostipes sp.]|nr:FMN-binding protein [Anaerostipes sp.]